MYRFTLLALLLALGCTPTVSMEPEPQSHHWLDDDDITAGDDDTVADDDDDDSTGDDDTGDDDTADDDDVGDDDSADDVGTVTVDPVEIDLGVVLVGTDRSEILHMEVVEGAGTVVVDIDVAEILEAGFTVNGYEAVVELSEDPWATPDYSMTVIAEPTLESQVGVWSGSIYIEASPGGEVVVPVVVEVVPE